MKTLEKNPTIENVNYNELVGVLMNIESGTFVNIEMFTDVRMNKTGNPFFGKVKKYSSCNYLVGNSYQDRVNSNIKKENETDGTGQSFKSEKPKGQTHVSKCVLVDDKTGQTHYLMVERFNEIKPQTCLMDNDFNPYIKDKMDETQRELFEQFVEQRKVYESKKQPQERKVMVLTPKVKNILSITIDKIKYVQNFD